MTRHEFFKKRLAEWGLYDADADYHGMIGEAVEQLSAAFAEQRHSGASAVITRAIFNRLMDEWDALPINEDMNP